MAKIVTLGEIMLRLSTKGYERFVQADDFDVCYGGGEANVAVSLAGFGHEVSYITKLPDNEIGESAKMALQREGVDCSHIVRGGERLGIYFLETGASVRPSKVIYDRAHSAIAEAKPEDFDFDAAFEGADWFHFTGITPAISDTAAEVAKAALIAAKKHGLTVSCDLNYRKKLWSSEKAQKVMTDLMQYVDVCIGNEEDAQKVLGFVPGDTDVTKGSLELAGYEAMFRAMKERFGFRYVVSSLRESFSATDNAWSAAIWDGETFYHSRRYNLHIVDRVGGGDSFAAGLICGLADGKSAAEALEFAVAASALKHTIPGDFNHVTRAEVETLAGGDGSGRVQR
ncbi:MAG: sugar kinase [Lachnospiraceae bacterium]|nr:sugar kinase [Lachnospiraceae bacterium]